MPKRADAICIAQGNAGHRHADLPNDHLHLNLDFVWRARGGRDGQAADKDSVVVILRPGLEKGQIETALDAAEVRAGPSPCAGKTLLLLHRRLRPPRRRTASGMPSKTASRPICKD